MTPEPDARHEHPTPPTPRRTLFGHPLVWALFAGIIVVAASRSLWNGSTTPAPKSVALKNAELGQVPPFRLLTPEGLPFGSEDLRGTVYVANFFFTRCPSICPMLTDAMAQLQERYDREGVEEVRLVSFTVDPENDTPERLAEYARAHGVNAARWTFLTGSRERVREVLVEGFRVMMGEPVSVGENLIDIAHTGKFVLVDQQGGIRGLYDYQQAGLDALFKDSLGVAREKP